MTWVDERKNHNGEPKKPGLLPSGEQAKEIIEVLVAMYRTPHKPEHAVDDDAKDKQASEDEEGTDTEK
jgi:hypothetical protein